MCEVINLKKKFIGVELIYNVVLVSGIQQSERVIHKYISTLFILFFHIGHIHTTTHKIDN